MEDHQGHRRRGLRPAAPRPDQLASDELVEVSLGRQTIEPENVEAGTGFYEQRFVRGEITSDMGRITVKKLDPGVAWGSVHWQFLEDMSKVTPYAGTPLRLEKSLYTRQYTARARCSKRSRGRWPSATNSSSASFLRTDRDMEYVHLKDQRASGTEPVAVLSQYKYQDGLGYYEATRDTASHFFINYLPKGVYVFEYAIGSYTRASTRPEWPRSSACTPRSSTAIPRATGWK